MPPSELYHQNIPLTVKISVDAPSLLFVSNASFSDPVNATAQAIEQRLAQLIERAQQNKKFQFSVCLEGLLLTLLHADYPQLLESIITLANGKQLEILASPFNRPAACISTPEDFASQLQSQREFWSNCNCSVASVIFIDASLLADIPKDLILDGVIAASNTTSPQFAKHPHLPLFVRSTPLPNETLSLLCLDSLDTTLDLDTALALAQSQIASLQFTKKPKEVSHIPLPAKPEIPQTNFHKQLHRELCALKNRIAKVTTSQLLPGRPLSAAVSTRLQEAKSVYLQATHASIWQTANATSPVIRIAAERSLITAAVTLDEITSPNVDPNHGWLQLDESGLSTCASVIVDTQLLTTTFATNSHGGLTALRYKPRKINFQNAFAANSQGASFVTSLTATPSDITNLILLPSSLMSTPPAAITYMKTRQTPGLIGIRFKKQFDAEPHFQFIEDYTFRTGIGAHMNNATTGWTFEHWLEGNSTAPDDQLLRIEWQWVFATPAASAISMRPLAAAGGEDEHATFITEPRLFDGINTKGGLNGVRIVDGVDHFVLELRSARPLFAIHAAPIEDVSQFQGIHFSFFIPAKKLFGDENSNAIHFSIA